MTLLIIGRNGQLARALAARAASRGLSADVIGRPGFDLANFAGGLPGTPRVVLNAAAYTAVDRAEDERDVAETVNGHAVGALAEAANLADAFIHFSTDYVFAGDKDGYYGETDPVAPINAYGESKLSGERAALAVNPRTVILRTAWVYDAGGSNFVRTMLRLAKTRDEVGVVADQRGCPTYAADLADAALTIAESPKSFGVFHCANAGETTWAEFAEEIFAQSRALNGPSAAVKRISALEFPTKAKRPANSRLDCSKLEREYGVRMRPWREALAECMAEIKRDGWSVG